MARGGIVTLTTLLWLLHHGWHVWVEWHPYYADHARGGWNEWLACKPTIAHGQVWLNGCRGWSR